MTSLTKFQIAKVVNRFIGVNSGYLGDFSYRTHAEFYIEYCDLEIDPYDYEGTTREKFIKILKSQSPFDQAKILRGVLERFPLNATNAPETRTIVLKNEIEKMILNLQQNTPVASLSPQVTSDVIEQALRDAENLLLTSGATSSVDRVHTALHGYLRELCSHANISYAKDDSINRLLKLLRQQHKSFQSFTR